jgi:UPF0755 protein
MRRLSSRPSNKPGAEPPQKPRRRAGRFFAAIFTVAVVIAAGFSGGAWLWLESRFNGPGGLAEERILIIPKGDGPAAIARDLQNAGIVADARVFRWGLRLFGDEAPLRAGEFAFPAAVSPADAARILQSGRTAQRRLTIAEGLSRAEIASLLAAAPGAVGAVGELPDEGWLLPETYHYTFGEPRREILQRMHEAMAETAEALWPRRAPDLPLSSVREAVILASIVEKETGVAAERARVAAVFINRLNRGMRLQSDPTVVYGLTRGEKPLDRPLTRTDLQSRTPYNTYVIKGLPPTAIANPGRAALEAVLRPAESDDLYFVADGSGGHAFSKTLKGHQANVAKWRKIERQRRNGNP